MSPTARTLKELRSQGFVAEVVEHYNSFSRKRHDLFSLFDILAIREGRTLGLQVTTESNNSARKNKMMHETSHTRLWLSAHNDCELWTWKKIKHRWRYRRRVFTLNRDENDETKMSVACQDEGWNEN